MTEEEIDAAVDISHLRERRVRRESVGVHPRALRHAFRDDGKHVPPIELLRLDVDEHFSRTAVKDAENRQFVGTMPALPFDAAYVKAGILPLAANVRLVELDGAGECRQRFSGHASPQHDEHERDTVLTYTRRRDDCENRPLPYERFHADLPFGRRCAYPDVADESWRVLSAAFPTFSSTSTHLPKSRI